MNNYYKNIPESGFTSTKNEVTTTTVEVSMKISSTITLTIFSILQLIAGATYMTKWAGNPEAVKDIKALNPFNVISLIAKLFECALAPVAKEDESHKELRYLVTLDILRGDVEIMLRLLEVRMKHCEEMRDSDDLEVKCRFNPDTYIGQKLLLIDLREWLALSAIPAKKEDVKEFNSAEELHRAVPRSPKIEKEPSFPAGHKVPQSKPTKASDEESE